MLGPTELGPLVCRCGLVLAAVLSAVSVLRWFAWLLEGCGVSCLSPVLACSAAVGGARVGGFGLCGWGVRGLAAAASLGV
ncbi:hypothetical protein U1Q18_040224 [Sarracenia purpurea var. burkii]